MEIKVLKNTKGTAGKLVHCNFNGETMQITEMASVDERDIPRQRRNGESEDWRRRGWHRRVHCQCQTDNTATH